jgi:hypothetical protein
MERFRIKEFFPKYIKLYSNNVWFNNIKTISTFLKFYMEKMERYTKQNFTNVVGADLLDLDYTVYFPYIDFFVTENEKHFLYGIDDMKVKTFDEFKKLLNK